MDYSPDTALVVVDVQNDFADPNGALYVREGETIIGRVNREIEHALNAGAPVFYTQDWHPESTPHFKKDGGIWPVHCVKDTWGAELHPNLHIKGEVVRKGTGGEDGYSGFTVREPESGRQRPTGLEDLLRRNDAKTVVIAGLATDYCVKETALDARAKGFEVVLLTGAVRGVNLNEGDDRRALESVEKAGGILE